MNRVTSKSYQKSLNGVLTWEASRRGLFAGGMRGRAGARTARRGGGGGGGGTPLSRIPFHHTILA